MVSMKKKNIIIVITTVVIVMISAYLLTRPKILGNLNHSYTEQITPFRYVEPVPLKYFIQKEAKINKVIDIKGLTDCLNEHRSVLLYYRAGMTDQTG